MVSFLCSIGDSLVAQEYLISPSTLNVFSGLLKYGSPRIKRLTLRTLRKIASRFDASTLKSIHGEEGKSKGESEGFIQWIIECIGNVTCLNRFYTPVDTETSKVR